MASKNLQFRRQGIISLESGDYIFRGDVTDHHKYWAWLIEYIDITDRSQCYKWIKLPKSKKNSLNGHVELFDLDFPPRTVRYLPQLD
jgi:hypothetical protein